MNETIRPIVEAFDIEGQFASAQPIESGHINSTFRVDVQTAQGPRGYLLQQINTQVFQDPVGLQRNIARVGKHLLEKLKSQGAKDLDRRVLHVVPTRAGEPLHVSPAGEHWRMYHFVERAHAVPDDPSPEETYQAGLGFGRFISQLLDLPASRLVETIPNFHHGPLRFKAFTAARDADVVGRRGECDSEVAFIEQHEWLLAEPQRLIEAGTLSQRVTHNDTKSNNVLLDDDTNEALCVIDLDTVMPGLVLYDIGDLVRTTSCQAAEDETDLGRVVVEADRLEHAITGFCTGTQGLLTDAETESLRLGPAYMALIMATRFLTDYLAGDTYYRVAHERHNIDRARNQITLIQGLLAAQPQIDRCLGL